MTEQVSTRIRHHVHQYSIEQISLWSRENSIQPPLHIPFAAVASAWLLEEVTLHQLHGISKYLRLMRKELKGRNDAIQIIEGIDVGILTEDEVWKKIQEQEQQAQ